MENLLEKDLSPGLEHVQKKTIEKIIIRETKKKALLLYIFLFFFLLIPVLSIESVVGWFLGISGIYKTMKLYKGEEKGKTKKSFRLLVIYAVIAAAYNLLAYYAQLFF